jgi:collagenase-like PrtC family protease
MGVARFRLSPHSCDMVEVASLFRSVLDRRMAAPEATARLDAMKLGAAFSNGFYYGKPGYGWSGATAH